MKKQSLKDRMHEHLGEMHKGKKKQSMKARVHESEGMDHEMGHKAAHAIKSKAATMHHKVKKMKSSRGR